MATRIPTDLIEMLRERRVIPFIGAGFSAALGLPDWDAMLRSIATEVQGAPPYDEIKKCCQGDHLQIAEYFFLKFDKSIGPIRHRLASLMQPKHSPLLSTAHVELVNLNAQQIYTTNYDESIEQTYNLLGHAYSFVALPKHIALADRTKAQVVKYHGDLRYDSTLVLTESSYYSRLEFESPMDLKFRSDLLGRSVLFIGYSFRDINIRIIWFKLMEMMRDVPQADRPSSFVVRFEQNEVLEELYKAVGIRTLYLDPKNQAKTSEERTKLLESFMVDLAIGISDDGKMPGVESRMFTSLGLLESITSESAPRRSSLSGSRFAVSNPRLESTLVRHAAARTIPKELASRVDDALRLTSKRGLFSVAWLLSYFTQGYFGPGAAVATMRILLRESTRSTLLQSNIVPWAQVWATKITAAEAESFLANVDSELENHSLGTVDADLAYSVDLARRIQNGTIVSTNELEAKAAEAVKRVAKTYPAAELIDVAADGPPTLDDLLAEIVAAVPPEANPFDDEIPF